MGYLVGEFTVAAGKALELQSRVSLTRATDGYGVQCNLGRSNFTPRSNFGSPLSEKAAELLDVTQPWGRAARPGHPRPLLVELSFVIETHAGRRRRIVLGRGVHDGATPLVTRVSPAAASCWPGSET